MKFYLWDSNGIFFDAVNVDDLSGSLPMRSTQTEPPKLTGTQAAHWTGEGWEVLAAPPTVEPQPVSLESLKVAHTLLNNSAYESAIGFLTRDYPAAEITTWERQRAEVVAWDEDNSAATPWIDIAASARGLDRGEYLVRTLTKVNAFATASAFLTGRRQGIDDVIRAATTAEQLDSVVIDYTLPGVSAWV